VKRISGVEVCSRLARAGGHRHLGLSEDEASHTNRTKFLSRDAVLINAICCRFGLASQSQRRYLT